MINSSPKRLSLSVTPSHSTSSGLANRRRNNKNLSLCLSPDSANAFFEPAFKTANTIQKDNVNAYPLGPAKIMSNLYLGSEKNASDLDHLKQLSVHAILNVAAEVNNPYEYLFQSMDDLFSQPIIPSPSLSKASSVSSTASSIQTVADGSPNTSHVAYQKLPWQHNQENLAVELTKAIDIIDRARAAGQTILVHCQCGVARSATVIIAYVMKTYKMPMQEAYNHVKHLAPPISPNLGLLFQLREFEQKLNSCVAPVAANKNTPPVAVQTQEPSVGRNHSCGRPKSWIASTAADLHINKTTTKKATATGFLLRASSLCLKGPWRRKLKKTSSTTANTTTTVTTTTTTTTTTSSESQQADGWWKSRKVSLDNTTSVCC